MNDPGDPANPLQGLLGDLLKIIGTSPGGGVPWLDAAKALAQGVATDGAPESNPDPVERIRLEELLRVAELHVTEATGLPVGREGHPPSFVPVGRGAWALRTLDAWRPLLERTINAQGSTPPAPLGLPEFDEEGGAGLQELLGRFALTMGPVLLGMQFGSAAGHLARRAMGQYALPIPWPPSSDLLVVPQNVAAFAGDWSLPVDETQLWVCVRELTTNAVFGRPHVADRFTELLVTASLESLSAQQGLAERLGEQGDPESLASLLSDPESLLADLLTPSMHRTSSQLTALTTTLGAYVDHVTVGIAEHVTGSSGALREAWYRYRVADAKGEQAAGSLFGLDLGRAEVDRGADFVRGVVERAGDEGLARLWNAPRYLPTPAEVDAPGLWLERISLPDDEEGPGGPTGD